MRQKQLRVVVAEDRIELQEHLVNFLLKNGLHALGVSNGTDLDHVMARHRTDVLLLNLGLKCEDGTPMLKRLHGSQAPHIVILSSNDDDEHRILAFEAGADDYLLTPVNLRLLLAVLRRVHARFQTGTWRLQPSTRRLHTPAGIAAALTDSEVCMLEALACADGRTVPRRQLIEALGHDFLSYDERRLEVGISRLRKKIKNTTGADAPLRSGWGLGYAFTEPCVLI